MKAYLITLIARSLNSGYIFSGEAVMEVTYPKNSINPTSSIVGGAGFSTNFPPASEVIFSFKVRVGKSKYSYADARIIVTWTKIACDV